MNNIVVVYSIWIITDATGPFAVINKENRQVTDFVVSFSTYKQYYEIRYIDTYRRRDDWFSGGNYLKILGTCH